MISCLFDNPFPYLMLSTLRTKSQRRKNNNNYNNKWSNDDPLYVPSLFLRRIVSLLTTFKIMNIRPYRDHYYIVSVKDKRVSDEKFSLL